MKKYDIYIGIDPDCERSGVAYLERSKRALKLASCTFFELYDYLLRLKEETSSKGLKMVVIVEAGYLITTHWHLSRADNLRLAAAKGNSAGRNHETARKIVEMCQYLELDYKAVKPVKKCWRGKDRKITHEELKAITNIDRGRTNQEERDAALLAWLYADLPILMPISSVFS